MICLNPSNSAEDIAVLLEFSASNHSCLSLRFLKFKYLFFSFIKQIILKYINIIIKEFGYKKRKTFALCVMQYDYTSTQMNECLFICAICGSQFSLSDEREVGGICFEVKGEDASHFIVILRNIRENETMI